MTFDDIYYLSIDQLAINLSNITEIESYEYQKNINLLIDIWRKTIFLVYLYIFNFIIKLVFIKENYTIFNDINVLM